MKGNFNELRHQTSADYAILRSLFADYCIRSRKEKGASFSTNALRYFDI
jgi:hypothetical protein